MSLTNDATLVMGQQNAVTHPKSSRMSAMDIQRGFIMILMAFAHCREYVGTAYYHNLDWNASPDWQGTSLLDLLQQILVSTIAAGGFFMMMGIGIIFLYQSRLKEGWSIEKVCRYLIMRGSLLIFLQFTLLQCFEILAEHRVYFYMGVLFSLGTCMIFSSLLLYAIYKLKSLPALASLALQYYLPLFFVITIPVLIQLMINHLQQSDIQPSWLQILLLLGGHYKNSIEMDINFTPIPWFPAVAMGLVLGQILHTYKNKAFKIIGIISAVFLFSWLFIRLGDITGWLHNGDYKLFAADSPFVFANLFATSKYPPSITYFLWALGINMACIVALNHLLIAAPKLLKPIQPLKIFGQSALFFFILHWLVYFGWSLLLPERYSSVWCISLIWLAGLVMLYPICKLYYAFKMQKPKESIWRMF